MSLSQGQFRRELHIHSGTAGRTVRVGPNLYLFLLSNVDVDVNDGGVSSYTHNAHPPLHGELWIKWLAKQEHSHMLCSDI